MSATGTDQSTQLLEDYLSSGTTTAESTAKPLLAKSNNDVQDVSSQILALAQFRPSDTDQTALVSLVSALQAQVSPETFQQFGWAVREAWNYSDPPETDAQQAGKREQWRRVNEFAARLAANGDTGILLNGLWTLRSVLEDGSSAEGYIPAAAQWMIYAGNEIYQSTETFQPKDGKAGDPARPGKLFDGSSGFSSERWAFWKEGFKQKTTDGELSDETRRWARQAVEAMATVEAGC